jgi:hypothetical protein
MKDRNREMYLNFINAAADDQRRTQTGTPLHIDYIVTIQDSNGADVLVHIILLDNRYEYDKSATENADRFGEN